MKFYILPPPLAFIQEHLKKEREEKEGNAVKWRDRLLSENKTAVS